MNTNTGSKWIRFACAILATAVFGANFAASQTTLRDCPIVIDPAKDPSTGTFRMLSQFSTVQIEDATGINNGFPNSPHNYNTGFAVGDFDNDGDPDLYIPAAHRFDSMANLAKDRLFLNVNGVLTDVTDTTPGAGLLSNGMGAVAVDYDNDGDMDIYVANYLEPNALLRNRLVEDGELSFEDVAIASRVAVPVDGGAPIDNSSAAVWADVDRDGDLDLYLVGLNNQIPNGDIAVSFADFPGDGERGTLLLNRLQEGQFDTTTSPPTPIFEDVTMNFGDDTPEMDAMPSNPTAGPLNHVKNYDDHMAATFADVNADLWPDLFVVTHNAIYVYINLGVDGTGSWRGFDRIDLNAVLTDPASPPAPDNHFVLATDTSSGSGGIPDKDKIESGTFGQPMGIDAGDVDNDGDIDFYISDTQVSGDDLFVNQMSDIGVLQFYHCQFNQDEGQFPWGTVISDVDLDGRQDNFLVHDLGLRFHRSASDVGASGRLTMFLMGENVVRIDRDNATALGDRPRSGAVADFDGDGRADFVARYQGFPALQVVNETIPTTFWLAFDLVGDPANPMGGLASSASAVGARVDLFDLSVSGDCDYGAASLWQTREKRAGHSNSTTSSEDVVRFGLSLRDDLCAQVSWPSGRLTRMRLYTPGGTPVASKYTLQEGASDIDLDEVPDIFDNCPADANAAQTDNDRDGIGNECDPSPDGSGGGGSNCDTCICNLELCEFGGEMIGSGPDYDGDGYVASFDMLVMLEAIGSPGGKGDLNKDGVVDISDMEVFLKYYGQAMPKSEK